MNSLVMLSGCVWAICCGAEEKLVAKPANPETTAASETQPVARWPAGRTIFAETELEKRVRAELARPFTHDFNKLTLPQLAAFLEQRLKCTVKVDEPALVAEEMDPKLTISGHARGRALETEMRSLLAIGFHPHMDLVLLLRDECVWITTKAAAESRTVLRVYSVHDLVVDPNDPTASNPNFERLKELIQRTYGSFWRGQGTGNTIGELKDFEGAGVLALVVDQNDEVHRQIEQLLAQLRAAQDDGLLKARAAPKVETIRNDQGNIGPAARQPLPPPARMQRGKMIYHQSSAERKIREVLRQRVKLDFADKSLAEIATELEKRLGIAVLLDVDSLTLDGKGPDTKFSLRWVDGELRNALQMLREPDGLAYVVRDDALVITTRVDAETGSPTVLYQVHDLVAEDASLIGRRTNFEVFVEIIAGMVEPSSWGDDWLCTGFEGAGIQVVVAVNEERGHARIEMLLDMLRDAYEPKVYEAQCRRPVVMPDPLKHPAVRGMGGGF